MSINNIVFYMFNYFRLIYLYEVQCPWLWTMADGNCRQDKFQLMQKHVVATSLFYFFAWVMELGTLCSIINSLIRSKKCMLVVVTLVFVIIAFALFVPFVHLDASFNPDGEVHVLYCPIRLGNTFIR